MIKYEEVPALAKSLIVGEPDEVWTDWEDIKIESSSR